MKKSRTGLKSKFEDRIKASHKKLTYETVQLQYTVPYTYKPDFVLTTKSKHKILIECKGGNSFKYFNGSYRKKWLCMYEQQKCDHDIRLIFEKDFKIGTVMTVSKWCEKYGIKYFIGCKVPPEWINE